MPIYSLALNIKTIFVILEEVSNKFLCDIVHVHNFEVTAFLSFERICSKNFNTILFIHSFI